MSLITEKDLELLQGFKFKTDKPVIVDDVVGTIKMIKEKSDRLGIETKIFIGTDSQVFGKGAKSKKEDRLSKKNPDVGFKCAFATAIVIHTVGKGARALYKRRIHSQTKPFDTIMRLWIEVEYSIQTALALQQAGVKADFIDLDLSSYQINQSSVVTQGAKGYAEGAGFIPRDKEDGAAANRAADKMCRNLR